MRQDALLISSYNHNKIELSNEDLSTSRCNITDTVESFLTLTYFWCT